MFIVDAHCDTITTLMSRRQQLFDNDCHVSIKKLKAYEGALQFFAVWLDDAKAASAYRNTVDAIDFYNAQVHLNREHFAQATCYDDVLANSAAGKVSGLLAVEGGEALEGDLRKLYALYDMGVRSITLTWNRENAIGMPSAIPRARGLTAFGKRAVLEMNALGIIVDVSHLSQAGFWDVADISGKPFIASHSNCHKLCAHHRNLDNDQLRAISHSKGVVGINLYPPFLKAGGNANITDVLRHIDHMLCVAGPACVGLGADFDGIECTPDNLSDISCYHMLLNEIKRLYGAVVAGDIAGGNMMRIIKNVT